LLRNLFFALAEPRKPPVATCCCCVLADEARSSIKLTAWMAVCPNGFSVGTGVAVVVN
jgi:hypothetical protein